MSYTDYPQASSDWNFRKWLVPALLVSLLFHCGLVVFFELKKLSTFAPVQAERLIPRAFKLDQVKIDPRLLQSTSIPQPANVATKPIPDVAKVQIPQQKRSFADLSQEIRATPAATDLSKPMLNEKPKIDPTKVDAAMTQMEARSEMALNREMESLRKQLISEKPESLNQPSLKAQGLLDATPDAVKNPSDNDTALHGDSAGPDLGPPGYSHLDQLLSQTGPVTSGTAPIYMPSNTLFDYDSYVVKDGVVTELQKLGRLIQKYPQATFVIEGYTDTFGTAAYNQQLSQNRAEAVKTWLLQNMGIDPRRVQARGLGSTKLLVSANENGVATTVEEQQFNRRVEIVIKTK